MVNGIIILETPEDLEEWIKAESASEESTIERDDDGRESAAEGTPFDC